MNCKAIVSVACAVLVRGLADQAGAAPLSQDRRWMTVDLVSGIVSYHDYDFTTDNAMYWADVKVYDGIVDP